MTTPGRSSAGLAGVVAAAVALSVSELVAGILGDRSPFVAVADRIIELTPGPVVRFAIDTFGSANRAVLLTSMGIAVVALGVGLGVAAARRTWLAPVVLAAGAAAGMAAMLADPLVPDVVAIAAPAGGAAAGWLAVLWLLRVAAASRPLPVDATTHGRPTDPGAAPAEVVMPGEGVGSRRGFLGVAGSALAAAAVGAVAGRTLQVRASPVTTPTQVTLPLPSTPLPSPPPGTSLDVSGVSPLITSNDRFYRIDTAFIPPRINPATHTVAFTGMVDRPFTVSFDELLALADTEADVTLACVSNEVGGRLVGNARWLGVPLATLLDRAGVQPGATQVVGRSVDGWTAGFPVEAVYDGRPALVAVGMNGEPLPRSHGFPVRLVIAGLYGYVSDTKWLSEVELTTFEDFGAYWTHRGWSAFGPIKTQSRIDVPRPGTTVPPGTVAVAGVAWAGERGVSAVEVSVDDGPWQEARLADALADTSWRQWVYAWDAPLGDHRLRVRATDGAGEVQTAEVRPPAPDGATGHHTVHVTVA